MYCGSLIKMADITDGTSNTYLARREIPRPRLLLDRPGRRRQRGALIGDNEDIVALGVGQPTAQYPPMQDTPGVLRQHVHRHLRQRPRQRLPHGLLRRLGADDQLLHRPETHRRLGNRKDGLAIDGKKF